MNNLTKDDESRVIATVIAAHDDTELHCNNPKEWEKRMQAALEVCFGPFLTQPSWKSLGEAERENYAQYIVRSTLPEEALTMAPVATLYAEAVRVGMNHWLPCHRREAMRKASANLARKDGALVPITRNQELVMDLMREFYRTTDGDPYSGPRGSLRRVSVESQLQPTPTREVRAPPRRHSHRTGRPRSRRQHGQHPDSRAATAPAQQQTRATPIATSQDVTLPRRGYKTGGWRQSVGREENPATVHRVRELFPDYAPRQGYELPSVWAAAIRSRASGMGRARNAHGKRGSVTRHALDAVPEVRADAYYSATGRNAYALHRETRLRRVHPGPIRRGLHTTP